MSSITAQALPDGSVRLDIVTATFGGVIRSDFNGNHPVRIRQGQVSASGTFSIVDREASMLGPIQYSLSGDTEPAWTEYPAGMLPRFTLPSYPDYEVVVETVHGYSSARRSRSTFHEVIGRADPIVAEGPLTPRNGRLEIWAGEYMRARELEALLETGAVAHYRQAQVEGMDMYFHASAIDVEPDGDSWVIRLEYVEAAWPSGYVATPGGWTFDVLASDYAAFDEVAVVFRNFNDLASGGTQ